MVDPSIGAAIVITAGGLIGNWALNRNTRRAQQVTTELQRQKQDADQVTADRQVTLGEFDSLRSELREQLDDVRADLDAERTARRAAEDRADKAEKRADALGRRVGQLERAMTAAGVSIPAES